MEDNLKKIMQPKTMIVKKFDQINFLADFLGDSKHFLFVFPEKNPYILFNQILIFLVTQNPMQNFKTLR
jgi:hypothetical protein